jgi:hypothetical protein
MFLNMSDAEDGNNEDLREIDLNDNAKLIYTDVLIKSSLLYPYFTWQIFCFANL